MAEQTCEISETPAQSRYAAEWGLATLVLAGFQTIAALLTLIWAMANPVFGGWRNDDVAGLHLAPIILVGTTLLFWPSTVICVVFGRHSIRAAWARCQPGGLPLAGTLLAILAFLLWSAIFLAVGLALLYSRFLGQMQGPFR